jgi:hypothetical protein
VTLLLLLNNARQLALSADSSSYNIVGSDAALAVGMPATSGAYTVAGQDATLAAGEPATSGTYAIAGGDAGLAITMLADAGTYSVAGDAALITPAATGTYVVTGNDAALATSLPAPVGGIGFVSIGARGYVQGRRRRPLPQPVHHYAMDAEPARFVYQGAAAMPNNGHAIPPAHLIALDNDFLLAA